MFLKRQEYRTDLFGVGAIAFDLISCGKSSERFYESIRRFEFDGSGRGSVESTIGKYRRVKDGLADEPELIHIFEPFRRGSDYAPEAFVELILRCMLYKADKTFYAPYEAQLPTPEQINDAAFVRGSPQQGDHERARLHRQRTGLQEQRVRARQPAGDAEAAEAAHDARWIGSRRSSIACRNPSYDWKLRLAQGAYYYEKLATLVQDRTKAADRPFLYQMLPAGIRWLPGKRTGAVPVRILGVHQRSATTRTISSRVTWTRCSDGHPSVRAESVAFARREVMLTRLGRRRRRRAPKGERCALRFLDAASYGSRAAGDWIVYRTLDDERHLWQIVETLDSVGRDHIVVSPVGRGSPGTVRRGHEPQIEALYYSRIVPARYYLDVLGLYLLNFLVANSSITTNNREKIERRDAGRQSRRRGRARGAVERDPGDGLEAAPFFEADARNGLRDIFDLDRPDLRQSHLSCSRDSYYGKVAAGRDDDLDPSEFMLDVVNDAKDLRNKVEDFLSVPRNTFENERPTDAGCSR